MEASYSLQKHESEYRSQLILCPLEYTLDIKIEEESYSGTVTIDFELKSDSNDLWLDYSGDIINSVYINSSELNSNRIKNHLLLRRLSKGKNKVQVEFRSSYSSNGTGLHKFVDPHDLCVYIYSYMCPYYANKVFPCFDQPDLKGIFRISIESNSSYKVISNQHVFQSLDLHSTTKHEFLPTEPLSTYLLAILCGDYTGSNEIYSRKSIANYIPTKDISSWIEEGMERYKSYFGKEMPFSKCTQVFCPEFNMGAMENAGCVTINDSHVWKEKPVKSEYNWLQNTILHELCHMWFGNYVTLRWWDDLWLNESFATFFSYLISSKSLNTDAWVGFLFQKMKAYSIDSLQSTHSVYVNVSDTQEAISNLDHITYWKGASLLKNLAFIIGEESFSEGLKRYFNTFAWGNVTLQDFVKSMQSPLLQKWVEEWVEAKGLNSIEIEIEFEDHFISKAVIKQYIVSGDIYRNHSILIEGVNEMGTEFKVKVAIGNTQVSEIRELLGQPQVKGLLLNSDDHGYVQVILDNLSMDFFFTQGYLKSQPTLNRGLAWQSLWNRVEKLQTTGSEFINIVSKLLIYEEDEDIIDLISTYSNIVIAEYCPKNYIPEYSHIIFNSMIEKLTTSPDNKCLQRKIFTIAHTKEDITRAYNYSLNLGRSEKWKGIMMYSTILSIAEVKEILKEELKYDRNDMSILFTNYCEAAAYDNKQSTWDMILSSSSFSMVQIEYAMKAFWQSKDTDGLEEFYNKYFEVLPSVIQNTNREFSENFMRYMIPKHNNIDQLIQSISSLRINQTWVNRFLEDTIQFLNKKKIHLSNFISSGPN